MNALFLKKPRGAIEMKRLLNHSACRGSWYNNLTALAKSKILTPERTLYHKLRISKEIRPATAALVAVKNSACCILQKKAQILQQNLVIWL